MRWRDTNFIPQQIDAVNCRDVNDELPNET